MGRIWLVRTLSLTFAPAIFQGPVYQGLADPGHAAAPHGRGGSLCPAPQARGPTMGTGISRRWALVGCTQGQTVHPEPDPGPAPGITRRLCRRHTGMWSVSTWPRC